MGGKFSREKGKRGERELASRLRDLGFETRRGQQFCGANGDADVVGLAGIHIEVKRTEKFKMYDALAQSVSDAKEDEIPIVVTRKNNCDWIVCLPLDDFIRIYRETGLPE